MVQFTQLSILACFDFCCLPLFMPPPLYVIFSMTQLDIGCF